MSNIVDKKNDIIVENEDITDIEYIEVIERKNTLLGLIFRNKKVLDRLAEFVAIYLVGGILLFIGIIGCMMFRNEDLGLILMEVEGKLFLGWLPFVLLLLILMYCNRDAPKILYVLCNEGEVPKNR